MCSRIDLQTHARSHPS